MRTTGTLQPDGIFTSDDGATPYQPKADCAVCHGAGFVHPVVNGRINYSRVVACEAPGCLKESIRGYRSSDPQVQQAGVIKPDQIFGTFREVAGAEAALKAAREYAEGKSKQLWLVIYGGVGNGKTHLCNAISKRLIQRGEAVKMVTVPTLLEELRIGMNPHTTDEILRGYKNYPTLILDEFGLNDDTPWQQTTLETLLISRFERGVPTVIATNLNLASILADPNADFPLRLKSRLSDKRYVQLVVNKAPDYRKSRR